MSGVTGDAADQVVRMSLEGTDTVIRLAGSGAQHLAVMLFALMRSEKKTKGRTRLSALLRSGKELRVFAVKDSDLRRFCAEAKTYGVLYTVLKDQTLDDGTTDVMIRAEDAPKVNRIFDRLKFDSVEMSSVKADRERERGARSVAQELGEKADTVTYSERKEEFIDLLVSTEPEGNPTQVRTAASSPSGPSLETRRSPGKTASSEEPERRPSVRKELEEIRAQLAENPAPRQRQKQQDRRHIPPKKKRGKKERSSQSEPVR